jgi:transposase
MGVYPARSVERAMKFQEVILRAMSKQITWMQAAEILGMSDRNMRRYRNRLEQGGYDGLIDRRTRRPSPKRVPMAEAERVLRLYREQYFDFNVRHFHEKLGHEHGITLSYTWVKNALQEAGLVGKAKKRGRHHKRRPRRPLPGMMLHIDGSTHAWLGPDHERFDLVTVMDDATSEIYYARFVEECRLKACSARSTATAPVTSCIRRRARSNRIARCERRSAERLSNSASS